MRARKVVEFEFVIWDGSPAALWKINVLARSLNDGLYNTHTWRYVNQSGGEPSVLYVFFNAKWNMVLHGDYVFIDLTVSLRSVTEESFLAFYEVIDD